MKKGISFDRDSCSIQVLEFREEELSSLLEHLYCDESLPKEIKLFFFQEDLLRVEKIFDRLFSIYGLRDKKFIYGFLNNQKE